MRSSSNSAFPLEYLDVGGGLGVDYDGSRAANESSTNYTLGEYARDVVYNVADVCNEEKVAHPDAYQRKRARDRGASLGVGG